MYGTQLNEEAGGLANLNLFCRGEVSGYSCPRQSRKLWLIVTLSTFTREPEEALPIPMGLKIGVLRAVLVLAAHIQVTIS